MNQASLNQNDNSQPKHDRQKNICGIVGLVCGIIWAMLLLGGSITSGNVTMTYLAIILSVIGIISSILGIFRSKKVGGLTVSVLGLVINVVPQLMLLLALSSG